MSDPGAIRIADYNYLLPDDRIAQFPLADRDASNLLVYCHGILTKDVFSNIDQYLPPGSLLVFNDTRVIRARIIFRKQSGAKVEIFCLEPLAPTTELQAAFRQPSGITWKCLVGNMKRWKQEQLVLEFNHSGTSHRLFANYADPCGDGTHSVEFSWDPAGKSFSEILELSGLIPLPPYIHRPAVPEDSERYQTIYALKEGSVAAPTAGLHFTPSVLGKLNRMGIITDKVTLHVGVGTFKPVTADRISDHVMHHERIIVSRKTILTLLNNPGRPLFAVGTTSARTLESLYWLGAKLILHGPAEKPVVGQWDPYLPALQDVSKAMALEALLHFLDDRGMDEYSGETQLMIVPGYRFRLLSGLITNFHMPRSTLLLLVAALVGETWKDAYEYALNNNFRFLSYGDSCLFFSRQQKSGFHGG